MWSPNNVSPDNQWVTEEIRGNQTISRGRNADENTTIPNLWGRKEKKRGEKGFVCIGNGNLPIKWAAGS